MINRLRKGEAGFTLIELLVVVLILGILVAIAVPNFTNQQQGAGEAAAKSNIRAAGSELAADYAQNGSLPAAGVVAGATWSGTPGANALTDTQGGQACSGDVSAAGVVSNIACP